MTLEVSTKITRQGDLTGIIDENVEAFLEINRQALPKFGIDRTEVELQPKTREYTCITILPCLLYIDDTGEHLVDIPVRFVSYTLDWYDESSLKKILKFIISTYLGEYLDGVEEQKWKPFQGDAFDKSIDFIFGHELFGIGFSLGRVLDRALVELYMQSRQHGFTVMSTTGSPIYISLPIKL